MQLPVLIALALCTVVTALFLDDWQSVLGGLIGDSPLDPQIVHYSTVDKSEWPIDVSQYEGNMVFRVTYGDEHSKDWIYKIVTQALDIDIWAQSMTRQFIDIRFLSESSIEQFVSLVEAVGGLKYDVEPLIEDLAQTVFENYEQQDEMEVSSDLFFKSYRPLKTIYAWMEILAQTYPDLVTIEWVGQTYEGRDLKAVHLRSRDSSNKERKTIVITGGMHAREWVSVSSTCFILNELLRRYDEGRTKERFYLDSLEFIFVPVMNPDGYEYTWTSDRLWRKNRQETYLPRCFGVDIDHSFDYHWQHSEDLPCGEDYAGEDPFESIESEIWNSYLNKTKAELKIYGYIDLHSYAQEILYPYAYSCDQHPRDTENLIELLYGLSKAIRLKSGKHYNVLSACLDRNSDLIPSLGSGSALDYMYHNRAFWAFQIKLRDSGSHGFLLPSKYILPVGKEIFSSIRYFCNFVLSND